MKALPIILVVVGLGYATVAYFRALAAAKKPYRLARNHQRTIRWIDQLMDDDEVRPFISADHQTEARDLLDAYYKEKPNP